MNARAAHLPRRRRRWSSSAPVAAVIAVTLCFSAIVFKPVPVAAHSVMVPVRACAVRTVYHFSQDDWGQRALVAATVLNRSPAPGAVIPCSAPPVPAEDGAGGIPDPYRLQSARDAVAAVANGRYDLPRACAGVTAFTSPEAAPRSQCVYAGLAFTTEGQ